MLIGFNVINSIELFRKHSISVLVMLSVSKPKKYHCEIMQSGIIQSPEASRATPRRTTIQTFRVCVEEILFRMHALRSSDFRKLCKLRVLANATSSAIQFTDIFDPDVIVPGNFIHRFIMHGMRSCD
jgi:hypothetical protein